VDEAPVPDAKSTRSVFQGVVCLKRALLEQQPGQPKKSVGAGPDAADVIAESVELANPAAAAIAVVIVARA
jgi:hypothetical protein